MVIALPQEPQDKRRKRDCYSDEHYVPVLLASLGLDNETTCNGNTVHVSWQSGSGEAHHCSHKANAVCEVHGKAHVYQQGRALKCFVVGAGKHIGEHPMSYSVKSVSLGVFLWLRQSGNMALYCNEVNTIRCGLCCPLCPLPSQPAYESINSVVFIR